MRLLHTLPYLLLQGFLYLLSWLPLCILYRLSDGCYLLVYHIVGYRKKLVRKHLAQCFPEKDEQERRCIERGFYHWFCDYVVETIKLLTMSKKEIMRRMTFKNISLLDEATAKGLSCGVYLGHYCNWEWITSLQLWVNPQGHRLLPSALMGPLPQAADEGRQGDDAGCLLRKAEPESRFRSPSKI